MRPPLPLVRVGVLGLLLLALVPEIGGAGTIDGRPKVLLHVRAVTNTYVCGLVTLAQCEDAVTRGSVNSAYHVFVLVARGDAPSIGGVQLGIDYVGQVTPAGGAPNLNVFGWTLCSNYDSPSAMPAWPAPGSGNLLTWDLDHACQTGEVAVAGYFYLAAYSEGSLYVRPSPDDGTLKVVDCQRNEILLDPLADAGCAYFNNRGLDGCNPCLHACFIDPVETATWSRIKTREGW